MDRYRLPLPPNQPGSRSTAFDPSLCAAAATAASFRAYSRRYSLRTATMLFNDCLFTRRRRLGRLYDATPLKETIGLAHVVVRSKLVVGSWGSSKVAEHDGVQE